MKTDTQEETKALTHTSEFVPENVYVFPLSFAQQRLWFLDQLQPNSSSYNVSWSIRMSGRIDCEALERSLNEIVRRHEILRTTFSVDGGEPVQVVAPSLRVLLPLMDLSDRQDREEQARRIAREEAQQPLDLNKGPLVRARLLRLEQDDHVLLLSMHHIIFDGWSRRILVRELATLYAAFCSGQASPLPALALQYADYAVWQRRHLQGENLDKQLCYWKNQLAGAPASLNLPTDRPRPAIQTFRGTAKTFALSQNLSERLNILSRSQGATLFMTLLAAFQALLARYSGEEDIVVGTPIANRNRSEIEGLIGFFANTLALRTDLSGDPTFVELLGRLKEVALGAYAHQDMPFEKLVEELRPERSLSHNPLFQVLFSLQNAPRQAFELAGLTLKPLEAASGAAKFDISLFMSETSEGIHGRVEYNTDLFDAGTMERMLQHYEVLLQAAVENPGLRISQLPLLTHQERQQMLVEWNSTQSEYARHLCLHQIFEQLVERTPDAVACIFDDQQLSYGELNQRANQVAHFLQKQNVGAGQRVGIFVERSLEMMIGLLGIQKSGAAYVPLDPAYPAERLRLTLEDAQVKVLLTQQSLLSSMPEHAAEAVCLDSEWAKIASESTANPASSATAEDLLYVIFTSGSTGRPKGVQVQHRAVVNLLSFMGQELNMGGNDVFPALASFAFDMCIPELYLPLMTGGRVAIGSRHLAGNGEELAAWLQKIGATIVHATPTTWNLLLEAGFNGRGLKRVIGAEPMPQELCRRLLESEASLYNFYGPTETTVWSAFHHFRLKEEPVVVGRPLANTQIYILDKNLQAVPVGVSGEIHIGGDGVTCGYLNRPELTAEKFIPDPFSDNPQAKLYKTGDLGRYLPDGRIEFQGRADNQVKIRGYRIELGEMESVLSQHGSVQECVVIAREDVVGDKRLVGYVVPTSEKKLDTAELRSWMQSRLPEYMVPVAWVEMERLPLSPNGKVDRKQLPAPDYTRPELGHEYRSARTPAEEVMAGIWAEVLKLDQVGTADDFFELGGHSLLATQVVSRIRQAFQVELPLRALFEAPTISGLAERVDQLQRQQQGLQAPLIERVSRDQTLPVSFAQQRLWFLDQLEPNNPLYNVAHIVRMKGALQVAALENSLNEIVKRHETLRTSFHTVNDQPVQVIAPALRLPLVIRDLSTIAEGEREAQARQMVMEEIQLPFQLSTGPLLRASLFKLDEQDHVLVLNTHHIVSDRWSLGVLSQELAALYEAFVQSKPSPLPALPIQYADYAVWQRQYLTGQVLEKQLAYWKQQLNGAPPNLELPTDRPRPPLQTFHGAQHSAFLPKALLDSLKQLSRKEGVTLFMTLLAALNVLLSRYSGQDDIVVGSPIAGRNRFEIEKLIGFFVNTLVLRTDLSGSPSFRELLERARKTAMNAYAHQDLPFEKLVEELQPERDLSRNPLFQVMLILQNVPTAGQKMADLNVGPFPATSQRSKFDLTVIVAEKEDGLRATFEYNTDLFDALTIERMLRHFQTLLQAVATDATQQIASLPILSVPELQQLIVDWNRTEAEYPRKCLHDLFAQQANNNPERTAVVCDKQQITYGELNARSNQLARYLRKRGVGAEVLVGLFMDRSIDTIVGLLGILKSGGAYVPLDPSYPKDRIAFILQDAKAAFLVTQQALLQSLPEHSAKVIVLDADWRAIAGETPDDLPDAFDPNQLAYVLYTSGSTGKPKGVQIEHRNLVNFVRSMGREPGLSSNDTLLAVTTLSFDIAGLELYLPLVNGGKVVLASQEEAADGWKLLALLNNSHATVMQATPATWRMLLESGWTGTPGLKALCGGEALPPELANQLLSCCGELWNMYGPTETTIWSSVYKVEESFTNAVPIGRPIDNTTFYILDSQQRPVPVGVTGELYIGGEGVARGYLDQPKLTAEKFVPDPFHAPPTSRLYKTGDLARYLPDGNVQVLGRGDFQVKIRGFRIELGEIEAVLSQHPDVKQAVVAAREDVPGDKRLVGYIVAKATNDLASVDFRVYLRQTLPDYMVPAVFLQLDALPLTANGKIDRRALPVPELASSVGYVPASTLVEKVLAGIWEEVLSVSPIGIHSNFFELGGHSLLATQVVSRIQRQLGLELAVRSLFEHPTIADLAHEIERHDPEQKLVGPRIPRLARAALTDQPRFPVSFAQQRLWILDRLEPNSAAYNIPIALRLNGSLSIDALETALTQVVRRHEVLRTEYHTENGEAVQIVSPPAPVPVTLADLSHVPSAEREAYALRLAKSEAEKPFNLSRGAVLRATLLRLTESEHVLLITVHHIAFDGWSVGTLLSEIADFYKAEVSNEVCRLPELRIQYGDFAAWQRQILPGQKLERQLSYWKQQLSGAPPSVDLPLDHARPAMQTFHGATQTFMIDRPILDRVQQLSRNHGATPFMTLLAAFNVLLSRYSGQEDLVVGSPMAGRNHPEIEKLIGLFVNTLVLRTDVSGNPSFLDLLRRMRETCFGAYAHQDVPFERLVEELNPERDLSRNPLFQIMFSLQNVPRDKWELPGLTLSPFKLDNETEKFDLSVNLVEKANGLKVSFSYNTDLFEAATIGRMGGHFQRLLEGIVANPEKRISELPLLDETERRKLLVEFNSTDADYPRDRCIHNFFEVHAERASSATALICDTERFSYGQLNARANRIAHYLQRHGVGPEILVALCLERSGDMLAAILGILKAGGAYVPLDPAYPKERLHFILEDAQASILLTQQSLVNVLPQTSAEVICLDADWPKIATESTDNPRSEVNPENLAYVLFTSGSTGRPKGVAIEHRSAAAFIQWAQSVFNAQEIAGTLFSTSVCFDLSVFEMFVPLSMGGKVILAPNALALPKLAAKGEVTLINTVPSAISELVHMNGVPDAVQVVNLAGEPLPTILARQIYEKTKVRKVYNLYGPTEDTTYSTYTLVKEDADVTIGRPISNTQAYILDANRNPAPVGVPGELHLAGEGLARGYFGRPELTAERFLLNPFSADSGKRMYRTGDLARFLPDGNIQYLGRIDNQVKIRGFRIELGEIESTLKKHPWVESAVVVAREDRPGDKSLVAYIVCSSGRDLSSVDLRNFVKASLPEYMIPRAFVKLNALPLTPNGKINRHVLPKPDATSPGNVSAVAPRDDFEVVLLRLWQRVLGIESIGMTDNFFELGGHSLLAVRLLAEIKNVTGKEIPLAALFQGATIEYLATLLRDGTQSVPHLTVTEIQRGGSLPPFFAVVLPGVNALGYVPLARHMGTEQPFYKLQGRGPRIRHRPYTPSEFENMAKDYIRAMRAVQPLGPYYIGGMCGGARIAFDMARLLEAQGQKVGLLAIFDTWVIENSQRRLLWYLYYYQQRLRGFARLSLAEKGRTFFGSLQKKLTRLSVNGKNTRNEWLEAYWPAKNFESPKYGGQITVFKIPRQPFYYVHDPLMGWGKRTSSSVEIQLLEANHLFMLREPHVQGLAARLSECLRRARTQADEVAYTTRVPLTASLSVEAKS